MKKPDTVEVDLPTRYRIKPEMKGKRWVGTYSIEIVRPAADERKELPVTTVTGCTSAEVYVKLGKDVPSPPPEEFDVDHLRSEIEHLMTATGSQTIIKVGDYHSHLQDLWNLLPKAEKPEEETKDESEADEV